MKKLVLVITMIIGCVVNSEAQLEGEICDEAVEIFAQGGGSCAAVIDLNGVTGYNVSDNGNDEGINPSCWGGDMNNVTWLKITPTETGTYTLDVPCYAGASGDVALAVFTGSCGSLSEIDCDDGGKTGGCPQSEIIRTLTKNVTYYIAYAVVDGKDGTKDGVCISGGTNPSPPANDQCGDAETLTLYGETSGTLVNASDNGDEVLCSGSTENNVWYEYTADDTRTYYFQVYNAGCANPAGFQVSFYKSDETCGTIAGLSTECETYANTATAADFEVSVNLTAGETYLITVDGQSGIECTFNVKMDTVSIIPVPMTLVNQDTDTDNRILTHVKTENTKNILHTFNIFGQEVDSHSKGIRIIMYDDGSWEKPPIKLE